MQCSDHCNSCTTAGPGKCDDGSCSAGWGLRIDGVCGPVRLHRCCANCLESRVACPASVVWTPRHDSPGMPCAPWTQCSLGCNACTTAFTCDPGQCYVGEVLTPSGTCELVRLLTRVWCQIKACLHAPGQRDESVPRVCCSVRDSEPHRCMCMRPQTCSAGPTAQSATQQGLEAATRGGARTATCEHQVARASRCACMEDGPPSLHDQPAERPHCSVCLNSHPTRSWGAVCEQLQQLCHSRGWQVRRWALRPWLRFDRAWDLRAGAPARNVDSPACSVPNLRCITTSNLCAPGTHAVRSVLRRVLPGGQVRPRKLSPRLWSNEHCHWRLWPGARLKHTRFSLCMC